MLTTTQNNQEIVNETFDALMECWREGQFLEIEGLFHFLIESEPRNAERIKEWIDAKS